MKCRSLLAALPACLVLAVVLLQGVVAEESSGTPAPAGTGSAATPPTKPTKTAANWRKVRQKIMQQYLLQYFGIGVEAPLSWMVDASAQGGRFSSNAMYISGSAKEGTAGEDQYYFKYNALENHIIDAGKANQVCWSTYYVLAQSSPALYKPGPAQATPVNAKVPGTMRSYFEIFKHCMQICDLHRDIPIVIQIEPDEWGHLLIPSKMDPDCPGIVMVGSSGMPELKGLPDSVHGWANAFRILRDLYAPQVILCANPSSWDFANTMSPKAWVKIFTTCDVNVDGGWDMFVGQEHDWDQGLKSNGDSAKWPPYAEKDLVGYQGSWQNLADYFRILHEGTGMWGAMWQLPVGNATYACCDGTDGHGCDGYVEALLDTYPKDGLVQLMAGSGCCLWIFSHGGGGACVYDAKADGITNPTPISGNKGKKALFPDDDGGYMRLKGGAYYKHPCPIFGKPKRGAMASMAAATGAGAAADPPPSGDKPLKTAKLIDPATLGAYSQKLLERIQVEIKAGHLMKISSSMLKSTIRIDGIAATGVMDVHMEDGGQMDLPWSSLALTDLLQLSQLQVRGTTPQDHALVGFYFLATNNVEQAEDQLRQATGCADEVRKLFAIQ